MNGKPEIPSWMLLVCAGLTSAILCTAPPLRGGWFELLYVGGVYGGLVGVHFIVTRGASVVPRVAILVITSMAAWPIAYIGSFWMMEFIPGATVHHGDAVDPAFPLLFAGGVLGGIVLLLPTVLLFSPSSAGVRSKFIKAFLGILLSGIVGGVAWELGPTLGAAIWSQIPTAPLPQPESYGMAALFFVWQPVMAVFIGWATKSRATATQTADEGAWTRVAQVSEGISRKVFGRILITLAVVSLLAITPVRLRLAHRERAAARKRESKPSGVNLPLPETKDKEEVLILRQIGDYLPGHATKSVEMVSHEKGYERPGSMYFNTLYTKTGEPVPEWPIAPRQYISVSLHQYPNSAWAQDFADYPQNMYNSFDDPKQHAIVTLFNNKVRTSQLTRAPGQTWIPLYYMWPSGTYVITLDYRTSDENLDILQAYLEKYPSSIR